MRSDTQTVTARDGVELFVRTWEPDGPARAIVHVAHGMAEHSGRYAALAQDLTDAGFVVWAHDHRGHGQTSPAPRDRGYFADTDGWATVVADIDTVSRAARAAHPELPTFFLGHSMGSLLGRDYVGRYGNDLAGAILSGTGGDQGLLGQVGQRVAELEARVRGPRHTSTLMNALTFSSFNKGFEGRTDFDWLSRDTAAVDAYVADPDSGFVATSGFFADLLKGVNSLPRIVGRIPTRLPVYLVSGDRDPVGGRAVEGVAQAMIDAGLGDVSLRLYPGGRHEMFQEINRDEVVADLVAWIDAHLPATTSAPTPSTPTRRTS